MPSLTKLCILINWYHFESSSPGRHMKISLAKTRVQNSNNTHKVKYILPSALLIVKVILYLSNALKKGFHSVIDSLRCELYAAHKSLNRPSKFFHVALFFGISMAWFWFEVDS